MADRSELEVKLWDAYHAMRQDERYSWRRQAAWFEDLHAWEANIFWLLCFRQVRRLLFWVLGIGVIFGGVWLAIFLGVGALGLINSQSWITPTVALALIVAGWIVIHFVRKWLWRRRLRGWQDEQPNIGSN